MASWNDDGMTAAQWDAMQGGSAAQPTEPVIPFAEWEFSYLSTSENSKAFSKAYNIIRKSIYDWGRANFPECYQMWDEACDVNLERVDLAFMFGPKVAPKAFATRDMTDQRAEQFQAACPGLSQLRHRVAHPVVPYQDDRSLKYVCEHIQYAIVMAKLLEDRPAIQSLKDLLEDLYKSARKQRETINIYKTLAGLPEDIPTWPKHYERLFERVVSFKCPAAVRGPSVSNFWSEKRKQAWKDWRRWRRIPSVIRVAAFDWAEVFDAPGVFKPQFFAPSAPVRNLGSRKGNRLRARSGTLDGGIRKTRTEGGGPKWTGQSLMTFWRKYLGI